MKRLLFVLLAMSASAVSAETIAYWRFGEKGLEDCSGHNIELVTTGVVAPADFLAERLKAGLTVILR